MWLIVAALVLSNVFLFVLLLCRGTCACGAAALRDCEVCHDDKRGAARYAADQRRMKLGVPDDLGAELDALAAEYVMQRNAFGRQA